MIKKVLVGDEKYKVLIGRNGIFKDFLPNSLAKNKKILVISDENIPRKFIELDIFRNIIISIQITYNEES